MAVRGGLAALSAGAALAALPLWADAAELAATNATPGNVIAKSWADGLAVEVEGTVASDYIYRGVSLSARRPTAALQIDADWRGLYFTTNVQSVNLPTNPAAEVTLASGYRWEIAKFNFDLGASYFYYPGEIPTDTVTKTNYWEYALNIDRDLPNGINLNAQFAYSPDVSSTGAWGAYSEAGITIDLPRLETLRNVTWQLMANAGYWRFGTTSPAQGGFRLPAFANWHAGLAFTLKDNVSLDLSYYDTNLSKEDCFVFTGDPMASPGGAVNLVNNPDGLRSRLCGAVFVGTLSFKFKPIGKD
jgi:uncharacterized protein (TIGR02001 family)